MAVKNGAGRPKAADAVRKKNAILAAAQDEFVQCGFRGASIRRVAERAGVSTRTMYNHYTDKLALFEACLVNSSETLQFEVKSSTGTLRERLIVYAAEIQKQMQQDGVMQIARLLYREESEFEELQHLSRSTYQRYQLEPVERILEDDIDDKKLRRELAMHYVALALAPWQRSVMFNDPAPGRREIKRHAEVVTDLFLHGAGAMLASRG